MKLHWAKMFLSFGSTSSIGIIMIRIVLVFLYTCVWEKALVDNGASVLVRGGL
jgi:hypothetical protein